MSSLDLDLRGLADGLSVGVIRLDRDRVVRYANPAVHVFAGRAPGSLVGRSLMEAFIDRRIEEFAEEASRSGSASGELTLRAADGPSLVVRARRTHDGLATWLTFEDVSELRRLQRIRSEFVDNLSHELRTPLTNVSLLAETLVRESIRPRFTNLVGILRDVCPGADDRRLHGVGTARIYQCFAEGAGHHVVVSR